MHPRPANVRFHTQLLFVSCSCEEQTSPRTRASPPEESVPFNNADELVAQNDNAAHKFSNLSLPPSGGRARRKPVFKSVKYLSIQILPLFQEKNLVCVGSGKCGNYGHLGAGFKSRAPYLGETIGQTWAHQDCSGSIPAPLGHHQRRRRQSGWSCGSWQKMEGEEITKVLTYLK
ncbi:unnamed protein product [Ranitomeya imitator]|uniref:Uncharacterized protein n=1 Tax=Ranitomeya imitator TaxID=111125 RepID=A0ABN9LU72_9NEOB|nr:unnamed protein product [Ranitomeya imitator]